MKTGNIEYQRNFYGLVSENDKFKDFAIKLNSNLSKESIFTEVIRIEKDNGWHLRSRDFEYWLYFRNDTNWQRCIKTGLAYTNKKFVFEGNISQKVILADKTTNGKDWENPQHFVIFQFSDDCQTVIVDIFKNFYPHKTGLINRIIQEHNFVYKDENRETA
jgi:hypothetical protein